MNKLLLGVFLGFFLHKGVDAAYSYSFWKNNKKCEQFKFETLDEEFKCTYNRMGIMSYIGYSLITFTYTLDHEWNFKL